MGWEIQSKQSELDHVIIESFFKKLVWGVEWNIFEERGMLHV